MCVCVCMCIISDVPPQYSALPPSLIGTPDMAHNRFLPVALATVH